MHPKTEKEFEKIVLEKEKEAIDEAITDHRKALERSQITHIEADEGEAIVKDLTLSTKNVLARGITEQDGIDTGITEQELIVSGKDLIHENHRTKRDVDNNDLDNPYYPIPVISRQDLSSLFNGRLFFVIPHENDFSYGQRKKVVLHIYIFAKL